MSPRLANSIKAALLAGIGLYLFLVFQLPGSSMVVVMVGLLSLRPNVGSSAEAGFKVIIGLTAGTIMGLFLIKYFGQFPNLALSATILWALVLTYCGRDPDLFTALLFCAMIPLLMVTILATSNNVDNAVIKAQSLLIAIYLGIGLYYILNKTLFPNFIHQSLSDGTQTLLEELSTLSDSIFAEASETTKEQHSASILASRQALLDINQKLKISWYEGRSARRRRHYYQAIVDQAYEIRLRLLLFKTHLQADWFQSSKAREHFAEIQQQLTLFWQACLKPTENTNTDPELVMLRTAIDDLLNAAAEAGVTTSNLNRLMRNLTRDLAGLYQAVQAEPKQYDTHHTMHPIKQLRTLLSLPLTRHHIWDHLQFVFACKVLVASLSVYAIGITCAQYFGASISDLASATIISILIVMAVNHTDTSQNIAQRCSGVIIGVILGIIGLYVLSRVSGVWLLFTLVISAIACTAYFAQTGPAQSRIAVQMGFGFVVVILPGYSFTADLNLGVNRILGILLGCAIAFIVSRLLYPQKQTDVLRYQVARMLLIVREALNAFSRITLPTKYRIEQMEHIIAQFRDSSFALQPYQAQDIDPEQVIPNFAQWNDSLFEIAINIIWLKGYLVARQGKHDPASDAAVRTRCNNLSQQLTGIAHALQHSTDYQWQESEDFVCRDCDLTQHLTDLTQLCRQLPPVTSASSVIARQTDP